MNKKSQIFLLDVITFNSVVFLGMSDDASRVSLRGGRRSVVNSNGGLRRSGDGCIQQARKRTLKMTVVIGETSKIGYRE